MSVVENLSLEPNPKRQKTKDVSFSSSYSSSNISCPHWCLLHGVCSSCKSTVNKLQGRSFGYLLEGLHLSHDAISFIKRNTTEYTSLGAKKLHLVLDLDHTLLHTKSGRRLSEAEKYLIEEAGSRDDLWKTMDSGTDLIRLTKLRPFLREFLKEADKMFQLYVYTMGNRDYARFILGIIDPKKIYFGNRVITRDESPHVKTLDLVLADECGVVIVDDTRDVWVDDHKSNLVEINEYNYFRVKGQLEAKSYAEEKTDESETDGGLANVLKRLKAVHREFFRDGKEQGLESKDVRLLLQEIDLLAKKQLYCRNFKP